MMALLLLLLHVVLRLVLLRVVVLLQGACRDAALLGLGQPNC